MGGCGTVHFEIWSARVRIAARTEPLVVIRLEAMRVGVSRRLVPLLGLVGAAVILKYSRIVQVAAFLFSAGLRMLIGTSAKSNPGPHSHEWDEITPPEKRRGPSESRIAITHHPWYNHHRAREANTCLALASSAGIGYLRSDVRWKDVLPDAFTPDERAIRWYRSYFEAARNWYGMEPIIVLSEAPKVFASLATEERMLAWNRYVGLVADHFGDLCTVYQVLNEPNNPVWRFFSASEAPGAVRSAAQLLRTRVPQASVAVNVLMTLPNWRSTLERLLAGGRGAIDIISVDHYPGTWSVSANSDWDALLRLAREIHNPDRGSLLAGRRLAIMETGYATNLKHFRTQREQALYLKSLASVANSIDERLAPERLEFLGVYEVCDDDSSVILDPEAHFGVLTSDLREKEGFAVLKLLSEAVSGRSQARPNLALRLKTTT